MRREISGLNEAQSGNSMFVKADVNVFFFKIELPMTPGSGFMISERGLHGQCLTKAFCRV